MIRYTHNKQWQMLTTTFDNVSTMRYTCHFATSLVNKKSGKWLSWLMPSTVLCCCSFHHQMSSDAGRNTHTQTIVWLPTMALFNYQLQCRLVSSHGAHVFIVVFHVPFFAGFLEHSAKIQSHACALNFHSFFSLVDTMSCVKKFSTM